MAGELKSHPVVDGQIVLISDGVQFDFTLKNDFTAVFKPGEERHFFRRNRCISAEKFHLFILGGYHGKLVFWSLIENVIPVFDLKNPAAAWIQNLENIRSKGKKFSLGEMTNSVSDAEDHIEFIIQAGYIPEVQAKELGIREMGSGIMDHILIQVKAGGFESVFLILCGIITGAAAGIQDSPGFMGGEFP